jgi:hypothetical protein
LVVLFLPTDAEEWQSLRGAPPTPNSTGATVKLPVEQELNTRALKKLAARLSILDFPSHPAL